MWNNGVSLKIKRFSPEINKQHIKMFEEIEVMYK